MTSVTPSLPRPARSARPVLADLLPRSIAVDAGLVVGGAALTAGAAQLAIPMWPVPITGQTFAVLLVGAALGPLRGALSMGLYLVLGVIGLPIFTGGAHGSLFELPSGGYIIGFVIAAALVGALSRLSWDRKRLTTAVAFLAGSAVMYAIGLPWLYVSLTNLHVANALQMTLMSGFVVFIVGDVVKAIVAAALLPLTWRAIGRRRA